MYKKGYLTRPETTRNKRYFYSLITAAYGNISFDLIDHYDNYIIPAHIVDLNDLLYSDIFCEEIWRNLIEKLGSLDWLRLLSVKYPPRISALKKAETRILLGYSKTDKPRFSVSYTCQKCNKSGLKNHTKDKKRVIEWNVDHICPVADDHGYGDVWHFADELFCEEENLWLICVSCHSEKTALENQGRVEERKKIDIGLKQ